MGLWAVAGLSHAWFRHRLPRSRSRGRAACHPVRMAADRDRLGWQRLADVQIPRGTLWVVLLAGLTRMRREGRELKGIEKTSAELATLIGTRRREGDERDKQLVELQASIERMTRWLVGLTIAVGLIGLAGIGATLWAALG